MDGRIKVPFLILLIDGRDGLRVLGEMTGGAIFYY